MAPALQRALTHFAEEVVAITGGFARSLSKPESFPVLDTRAQVERGFNAALTQFKQTSGPLFGFVFGVTMATAGFGVDFVLGRGAFWAYPPTDFSSHLIGYRAYVNDAWHWPLFETSTLNVPVGLNLLYMDGLPLVALFAKILRPVVPSFLHTVRANPFGLWLVLSYGLQGAFGALIVRQANEQKISAQICGSVVALSMSFFILRFIHPALNSHFLILAAIWLYLRTAEHPSPIRALAQWSALLVASLLIHPYLFAMASAFFAATACTWIGARRFVRGGLLVLGATATVAVAMTLSGFLGDRTLRGGEWGFGYKATDLASFFVPQWSPFYPTRRHGLVLEMASDELSEGWAYVGAGVIGLSILVAAVQRGRAEFVRSLRRHPAIALVLACMTLFALSNRITVAHFAPHEFELPPGIGFFTRQFRASGRFIWPPLYAGSLWLVVVGFRVLRHTGAIAAVPLLAFVQWLDGLGNFVFVRAHTERGEMRYLEWDRWAPIVDAHRTVDVTPAFECLKWPLVLASKVHLELEFMGASAGLGLTSVRSSRAIPDCGMSALAQGRQTDIPEDRLIVLLAKAIPDSQSAHFERLGLACYRFQFGIVCSKQSLPWPTGFTLYHAPIDYVPGTRVDIGLGEANARLGLGWSFGENTHRWQVGQAGFIYLRPNRALRPGARLHLGLGGALLPTRPTMTVNVLINGLPASTVTVTDGDVHDVSIKLPARAIGEPVVEIELRPSDFRSPASVGPPGSDTRELGAVMTYLSIVD